MKTSSKKEVVLFKETQRLSYWLTIPVIVVLTGITIAAFVNYEEASGDLWGIIILALVTFAVSVLLLFSELKTIITTETLYINYRPFVTREWQWSRTSKRRIFDYGFIGGWGIRIFTGYGTVYNARGSKGLHFFYKNREGKSKEYIVGTQKEEELKKVLTELELI